MPPPPAQKGAGKRSTASRDSRPSRSRNTTPSSVGTSSAMANSEIESRYLELIYPAFPFTKYDDIVDSDGVSPIPDSKALDIIMARLNKLLDVAAKRGTVCDRGMRLLAEQRKDTFETERREQERKEREAADEAERGRQALKMKKRKEKEKEREREKDSKVKEERPLTHGAHGVAAQDGTSMDDVTMSSPPPAKGREIRDGSASSSLSPIQPTTPRAISMADGQNARTNAGDDDDDSSSSEEHQPPPARAIPQVLTFGQDPWIFPDPTVYEIRDVKPGMSEEEIKEIYSVAQYPHNDLHDLIPGIPPDKDFSNAKPTNQVQATTFSSYIDGFMRPFSEEDLAFLRDRGDRSTPSVIPARGKKHYTEVWAEEDGAMSVDTPRQNRDKKDGPNVPRGNIEDMTDAVAETDEVSVGPVLSRLLSLMRPEQRAPTSDLSSNMLNGDLNLNDSLNGDLSSIDINDPNLMNFDAPVVPAPPATYMAESSTEAWKKANHPKLDHAQVDERLKAELRFLGLMPDDAVADYDAHYDDEIAARLRALQAQLKEQSIINGARKARLMDLAKERMAHQEYTTILHDLDQQVQTAFSKRTRTMGKSKKAKRPGGAGGGSHFSASSVARPGIGDLTKTLMDRRKKWIESIGSVFDDDVSKVPRVNDDGSSVFKNEDMAGYVARERDGWDDDADEE